MPRLTVSFLAGSRDRLQELLELMKPLKAHELSSDIEFGTEHTTLEYLLEPEKFPTRVLKFPREKALKLLRERGIHHTDGRIDQNVQEIVNRYQQKLLPKPRARKRGLEVTPIEQLELLQRVIEEIILERNEATMLDLARSVTPDSPPTLTFTGIVSKDYALLLGHVDDTLRTLKEEHQRRSEAIRRAMDSEVEKV